MPSADATWARAGPCITSPIAEDMPELESVKYALPFQVPIFEGSKYTVSPDLYEEPADTI